MMLLCIAENKSFMTVTQRLLGKHDVKCNNNGYRVVHLKAQSLVSFDAKTRIALFLCLCSHSETSRAR